MNTDLEEQTIKKNPNWTKSTENEKNNFKTDVTSKLNNIEEYDCINCNDVHCNLHKEKLEEYCMNVLEAVDCAAVNCLASSGGPRKGEKKRGICGWDQFVRPYKDESIFWNSCWKSAGSPVTGSLYDAMRHAKNQYKHAARRLKRAADKLQNDKFMESIAHGGCNIFQEIKKFRGTTRMRSSVIDGEVGSKNISDHFATIYSDLYSKNDNDNKLDELRDSINKDIDNKSLSDANKINETVIKEALRRLKGGKCDVLFDFSSDCISNGPTELVEHLTKLIRSFVVHGYVPYFLLICTLVPIVKNNLEDITTSSNYRAVAISSLILKILDLVILIIDGDKLDSDQLQFGFQANSSTTMCSWAVSAVVNYYNQVGTPVYGCTMDISKAFDMCEWCTLFDDLRERNVSPIFLRVLLFIYSEQRCDVRWNSSYSHRFPISNGVRQGTVSSPIFWSCYVNKLIIKLHNMKIGCKIGEEYYGILVYADEISS